MFAVSSYLNVGSLKRRLWKQGSSIKAMDAALHIPNPCMFLYVSIGAKTVSGGFLSERFDEASETIFCWALSTFWYKYPKAFYIHFRLKVLY